MIRLRLPRNAKWFLVVPVAKSMGLSMATTEPAEHDNPCWSVN